MDVVNILEKKRQRVTSYRVEVEGHRIPPGTWPRPFTSITVKHVIQGENITGRIQSVDDGGVTLVPEVAVKKGMKPRQGEPVKLPFDRIRNGKVEIEFSHLPEDGLEPEHNGPSEEA